MKQLYLLILIFIFQTGVTSAQQTYSIIFSDSLYSDDNPKSEAMWNNAMEAAGFTTSLPQFGHTPVNATSVRMIYTPNGIALRVMSFTDRVRSDGSLRDEVGSADYFSVAFDTWNDDQNAFVFTVTAAGQMQESRVSSTLTETGYNAPWRSKVQQTADGWQTDIWIPFTALRFPVKGPQDWGLQFTRFDRSSGELSTWNPQDPLINDMVWQYGQLEGMGDVRQKMRLGLSLLNRTSLDSEDFSPFPGGSEGASSTFGLDGRIGLNSATTLEVNLIPDINLIGPSLSFGFAARDPWIKRIISNQIQPLPRPRQRDTEESGLFSKSNLESNPDMSSVSLLIIPNLPRPTSLFLFNTTPVRNLFTTRFTTRTRSNWAIGATHTMTRRPSYLDFLSSDSDRFIKYPYAIYFTQVSAEKALRNNSWVQVSNGFNHLGGKMSTNSTGIATQLRDKTNRYAVDGNLTVKTALAPEANHFSRASGNIRASRINSRVNGYIEYQKNNTAMQANIPFTNTFSPPVYSDRFGSGISVRNYHPGNARYLNTSKELSFVAYNGLVRTPGLYARNIRYSHYLTTRYFRTISFGADMTPNQVSEQLRFQDVTLSGRKSIAGGVSGYFQSDSRKKTTFSMGENLRWIPESRQFLAISNLNFRSVVNADWIFTTGIQSALPSSGNYAITSTTSDHIYEKSKSWNIAPNLGISWIPNSKLSLNLSSAYRFEERQRLHAWKILTDGSREPVVQFGENARTTSAITSVNADITYNFNTLGYLRLSAFSSSFNGNFPVLTPPGGPILFPFTQQTQYSVAISFLYNFYRK